MSSDEDDDFLSYTPLQRSQVSIRESRLNVKPSRLSLYSIKNLKTEEKKNIVLSVSQPNFSKSKENIKTPSTPSKLNSPKVSRAVKKKTPIKSRADNPEANCNSFELAKWNFLFKSEESKIDKKPQLLKRKTDSGDESSGDLSIFSQQKRKNVSTKYAPKSTKTKQGEVCCSHCKFPFNMAREASLHSFLCDSKDLSNLPRCPAPNECLEVTEQHFWNFDHGGKPLSTPVKNLVVETEANNSSTINSGYNAIAGPSTSSLPDLSQLSSDIVILSDVEEGVPRNGSNHHSIPLFDLEESEDHEAHKQKESLRSESGSDSRPLVDVLTPDVELFEDDKSTVCFSWAAHSDKEQGEQENKKSQVDEIHNEIFGSETTDICNSDGKSDQIEDPEGDALIASVAEKALDQLAVPVMEKVMKWRKDVREAQASTPAAQDTQNPDLSSSKTVVQPLCIHIHYHEANPAPFSSKESGQTSILSYFKPRSEKESCPCGEKKIVPRQEDVAHWQGLMGHMQKRKLVPLPPVSQNSSAEERLGHSSHPPPQRQSASGGTWQRWRRKDASVMKPCPFYKRIPDTGIVVDAFSYGSLEDVTAYFLSHFHYDHYCGLRSDFTHPIYCSEITARLVNRRLGVPLQYLRPLPMWEPQQVCGVEVTLLDANHCPGAVMFLFKVRPGVTHLHVGDFRAHVSMQQYSALHCPINTLFLDTTYCSPEHVFPTQERMVEKCVSLAQEHHQRNKKTLFVVGSYTIGKEKIFKAIASSLNSSIWVRDSKKRVLNCINDNEIQERLSNNRTTAKVHVLPMAEVQGQKLKDYLNQLRNFFSEIVGMCPTGWTFTGASSGRRVDDISSEQPFPDVHLYGIPYSEHSSFSELRQFVEFIKPKKIIPTVNNGSQAKRKQMEQYFREWQTTRNIFP